MWKWEREKRKGRDKRGRKWGCRQVGNQDKHRGYLCIGVNMNVYMYVYEYHNGLDCIIYIYVNITYMHVY